MILSIPDVFIIAGISFGITAAMEISEDPDILHEEAASHKAR